MIKFILWSSSFVVIKFIFMFMSKLSHKFLHFRYCQNITTRICGAVWTHVYFVQVFVVTECEVCSWFCDYRSIKCKHDCFRLVFVCLFVAQVVVWILFFVRSPHCFPYMLSWFGVNPLCSHIFDLSFLFTNFVVVYLYAIVRCIDLLCHHHMFVDLIECMCGWVFLALSWTSILS